jgi:hypothetical protein
MFPTLVYELLKHAIPTGEIGSYLRFRTEVRRGQEFNHLVNTSAFTIATRYHYIGAGESLCGRHRQKFTPTKGEVTCPGCSAIGKNLAAFSLIS